jgi:hypothetical protein
MSFSWKYFLEEHYMEWMKFPLSLEYSIKFVNLKINFLTHGVLGKTFQP